MTYKNYKLDSKALFRGNDKTKQVGVYGSKKFAGPQNNGPASVGQRNPFDLTQHILDVITTTVTADADWTKDVNGIWNNTDVIGIGTNTPLTDVNLTVLGGSNTNYTQGFNQANHIVDVDGVLSNSTGVDSGSAVELTIPELVLSNFGGTTFNNSITLNSGLIEIDRINPTTLVQETIELDDNLIRQSVNAGVGQSGVTQLSGGNSRTTITGFATSTDMFQLEDSFIFDINGFVSNSDINWTSTVSSTTIVQGTNDVHTAVDIFNGIKFGVVTASVSKDFEILADIGDGDAGIKLTNLVRNYATDGDAGTAGLTTGCLYQTAGVLKVKL
jgi:hypothetical protein